MKIIAGKRGCKRGQATGGGPATLIILITILIVLYIVMLQPEDRVELLDEDDNGHDGRDVKENITLLEEHPGRLDFFRTKEFEHHIDSFVLYKTTESSVIKKENPFSVKNGWFDRRDKSIRFTTEDLENLENVLLSFTAPRHRGTLIITLNGETIFESELRQSIVDPIGIDKAYLREQNELVLSVSSVGWQFWSTNEYMIEALKLTGDMTDVSRQQSSNVFVLSEVEKSNIDEVKLKFNPDCLPNDVGNLEVFINNNRIFHGIPDCGILNTKQFSPAYLNAGQNSLVFRTDKGSYIVDNIKVVTRLEDVLYPFYYFDINETLWEDFGDEKLDFELTLTFFDDNEFKKAKIFINGRKTFMNTYDSEWTRNINNFVQEGTNGIKIEPDETKLEVVKMLVEALEFED